MLALYVRHCEDHVGDCSDAIRSSNIMICVVIVATRLMLALIQVLAGEVEELMIRSKSGHRSCMGPT